ncbi:MAG: sulfatase-like hydrolase/transferase [Acidobacteria bacterium]|nr:sulfatase-like hydrolase/transferase [Acidobacteriota bacterium]
MRRTLAVFGLLMVACGDKPVPLRVEPGIAIPVSVNHTTCELTPLDTPLQIDVVKGADYFLLLGNTQTQSITVSLIGTAPNQFKLGSGFTWVQLTAKQGEIWVNDVGGAFIGGLVPARMTKQPNVMLISIDTLRADMFNERNMPGLHDLFARHGGIWTQARTTAPWTLPAHASLLSGLYPASHGVRLPEHALGDVQTLAQSMRELGYHTVSVNEGNYLAATYGLNRGFDWYTEIKPDLSSNDPRKSSLLDASITTLKHVIQTLQPAPVFAFLHSYEVHCPYLPHRDLEDEDGIGQTNWLLEHEGSPLSDDVKTKLKTLYEGEVRYADSLLTPLVTDLIHDGWLVVLTSDHGEEFGEHGGLLHADTLFEEVMRVPLAIAGPGIKPGMYDQVTSILDVAPTILHNVGGDVPLAWQGRVLPAPSLDVVFGESYYFGPHIPMEQPRLVSAWQGETKLIQLQNFSATDVYLFDLAADPEELHNLQGERAIERDHLFELVSAYLMQQGWTPESAGELTEEQLELMRSLGYLK